MPKTDPREFLRQFEVLLFDMGDTFMFSADRFTDQEDYESHYRALGGNRYTNKELTKMVLHLYESLLDLSRKGKHDDNYPTLTGYMRTDEYYKDVPAVEQSIIARLFGIFECGEIARSDATVIVQLSQEYRLGLVSNIWAHKEIFEHALQAAGIYDLFEIHVFSSAEGCIKPSPQIFRPALRHFGLPGEKMVYIGNSYKRDVRGAANAGIRSILVNNGPASRVTAKVKPDLKIKSIRELAD